MGWLAGTPHVALTDGCSDWGQPVTPRRGKPVEINALWYSALCWAGTGQNVSTEEDQVGVRLKQSSSICSAGTTGKASLQKFGIPLLATYTTRLNRMIVDAQIRPNAILALSLHHCGFW